MKRLKMFIPSLIIMILLAGCTSTASNTTKNADDTTKGYIYIAGGAITITNSVEGIEGTAIELTSIVTSNGKTEMNGPGQGGGRNQ